MKLPMPTAQEIYNMADRAAGATTSSKSVNTLIIENAIRNALQVVVDRLNIDVAPIRLDLGKQG